MAMTFRRQRLAAPWACAAERGQQANEQGQTCDLVGCPKLLRKLDVP